MSPAVIDGGAWGPHDALEDTQEIPELAAMPPGVYMVTRHYSYRCDGSVRADPPNHPLTWLPVPERSLRNLPPEWQVQSGSWSSGRGAGKTTLTRYRK